MAVEAAALGCRLAWLAGGGLTTCALLLVTHLGTNWSGASPLDALPGGSEADNGGKSAAKSRWSLAAMLAADEVEAAASNVSSEATELLALFIVSKD